MLLQCCKISNQVLCVFALFENKSTSNTNERWSFILPSKQPRRKRGTCHFSSCGGKVNAGLHWRLLISLFLWRGGLISNETDWVTSQISTEVIKRTFGLSSLCCRCLYPWFVQGKGLVSHPSSLRGEGRPLAPVSCFWCLSSFGLLGSHPHSTLHRPGGASNGSAIRTRPMDTHLRGLGCTGEALQDGCQPYRHMLFCPPPLLSWKVTLERVFSDCENDLLAPEPEPTALHLHGASFSHAVWGSQKRLVLVGSFPFLYLPSS